MGWRTLPVIPACYPPLLIRVSDEYSRLELLGLEGIIKFDVLVVEKFAVEHFAIFCVPLGKRCRSVTSYTRFLLYLFVKITQVSNASDGRGRTLPATILDVTLVFHDHLTFCTSNKPELENHLMSGIIPPACHQ